MTTAEEKKHVHDALEDTRGLDEWAIVNAGNATFIGRIDNIAGERYCMQPAYSYVAQTQVMGGNIKRDRMVTPIELCASLSRVVIDRPSYVIRLSQASHSDLNTFRESIKIAEQMRTQARAQSNGLILPNGTTRQ